MKKSSIFAALLLVACTTAPTKSEPTEYKTVPIQDSVPLDNRYCYSNPTNPSGPYDTTLTLEDLELEGEFQDDTIGQPKY